MFQILKYVQIFQKILQEGHQQIQEVDWKATCSIFFFIRITGLFKVILIRCHFTKDVFLLPLL
jgi:hypothetical protein